MPKSFRQLLAERRDYEVNSGERKTDVGGNRPRPMDTKQLVKHLVATELSNLGAQAGMETFEEADDFEDEDPEPPWTSQFEIQDMEPEPEPLRKTAAGEPLPDPLEGVDEEENESEGERSSEAESPEV